MHLVVVYRDAEYVIHCGPGTQKVKWLARVAAQRFSTDGIWCPPEDEKIPEEFVPGRVFALPEEDELDGEAVLGDVVEDGALLRVELQTKPASSIPVLSDDGLEAPIILPKHASQAGLVRVGVESSNSAVVSMGEMEEPADHEGFNFSKTWDKVVLDDLVQNQDSMLQMALKNVFKRFWVDVVDIYCHYSEVPFNEELYQKEKKKVGRSRAKAEEETTVIPDPVMTFRKFALFCRTCRLTSPESPLAVVARKVFRDARIDDPNTEEMDNVCLQELDISRFVEGLIRIANFKHPEYFGVADRLNKLIHCNIFPYATGDLIDPVRDSVNTAPLLSVLHNNSRVLWKIFKKCFKPEMLHRGVATLTARRLLNMMIAADQFDDDLKREDLNKAIPLSLTFDAVEAGIDMDNDTVEISYFEFTEIVCRCALLRFKNPDERVEQKCELLVKRLVRATGV